MVKVSPSSPSDFLYSTSTVPSKFTSDSMLRTPDAAQNSGVQPLSSSTSFKASISMLPSKTESLSTANALNDTEFSNLLG